MAALAQRSVEIAHAYDEPVDCWDIRDAETQDFIDGVVSVAFFRPGGRQIQSHSGPWLPPKPQTALLIFDDDTQETVTVRRHIVDTLHRRGQPIHPVRS